jgi:hypothetical protein
MIIHTYSIMRNEEDLLPYFLRHYSSFADRIFIVDHHSSDNTQKLAESHPKVTMLDYDFGDKFAEEDINDCFENSYKKYSRGVADWVMVVDGDEFLYHPYMLGNLDYQKKRGRRVIKATGFTMFSETFPTTNGQIYEECNMGVRTRFYDKKVIFDPALDVKFGYGRHDTYLPDGVKYFRAQVILLHYRYISRNLTIKRICNNPAGRWFTDKRFVWKIKTALERYDEGIRGLKTGQLAKVI